MNNILQQLLVRIRRTTTRPGGSLIRVRGSDLINVPKLRMHEIHKAIVEEHGRRMEMEMLRARAMCH